MVKRYLLLFVFVCFANVANSMGVQCVGACSESTVCKEAAAVSSDLSSVGIDKVRATELVDVTWPIKNKAKFKELIDAALKINREKRYGIRCARGAIRILLFIAYIFVDCRIKKQKNVHRAFIIGAQFLPLLDLLGRDGAINRIKKAHSITQPFWEIQTFVEKLPKEQRRALLAEFKENYGALFDKINSNAYSGGDAFFMICELFFYIITMLYDDSGCDDELDKIKSCECSKRDTYVCTIPKHADNRFYFDTYCYAFFVFLPILFTKMMLFAAEGALGAGGKQELKALLLRVEELLS